MSALDEVPAPPSPTELPAMPSPSPPSPSLRLASPADSPVADEAEVEDDLSAIFSPGVPEHLTERISAAAAAAAAQDTAAAIAAAALPLSPIPPPSPAKPFPSATAASTSSAAPGWRTTAKSVLSTLSSAAADAEARVLALPVVAPVHAKCVEVRDTFLGNPQFSPHGLGRAAFIGAGLGVTAAGALGLALLLPAHWNFFVFVALVSVFHFLEFALQGLAHPDELDTSYFLLDHSPEFTWAMRAAVAEYAFTSLFFPSLRACPCSGAGGVLLTLVAVAGLVATVGGQAVRSLAMWEAGSNFTHRVALRKRDGHQLVTTGIYAWSRHPSYAGWFAWAVGLQLLLLNPLCTVLYAAAAFKFFEDRVRTEEEALVRFFGDKYREYRARVPTRIPFVE